MAGPPSTTYRLKKFVRRNVALSSAVLTAVVILVVGLIATTAMYVQADRARTEAQAVSDFLRRDILESLDPLWIGGREITVRSVLDAASAGLEEKLKGMPLAEAEIRHALGSAYWSLALYKQAELHRRRALELRRAHLGNDHPSTLEEMILLGGTYLFQSRYKAAESLCVEALEASRRVLGEEHADTLHAMRMLAPVYCMQGRLHEAEQLSVKALESSRQLFRGDRPLVEFVYPVALTYSFQSRYEEAERLYNWGLEISGRELGERHWWTLTFMCRLGELWWTIGRYSEAEEILLKALAVLS